MTAKDKDEREQLDEEAGDFRDAGADENDSDSDEDDSDEIDDSDEDDDDSDEDDDSAEDDDSDDVDDDGSEVDASGNSDDDDRAAEVASSLGVGDDDEEEEEENRGPKNRAERRRRRALKRRQKGAQRPAEDENLEGESKDRNVRKRERLLKRRRRVAQDDEEPDKLTASEMVDDALARGGATAVKWIRRQWGALKWVLLVAVVGTAGVLFYVYREGEASAAASDTLAHAVGDEQGVVILPDKDTRTDAQKKQDPRRIFKSFAEREKAALSGYQKVGSAHAGSGAAILAKLGEAGMLLQMRKWDQAKAAFKAVLDSPLAPADTDVKARALEGFGFAQEGKKDQDGAIKTFEKLASLPSPEFKVLSKFHKARALKSKGKVDDAKKLLLDAVKEVRAARLKAAKVSTGAVNPYRWLERAVEDALRLIDPDAVPAKAIPGGLPGMPGGALTPQQLQEKLRQRGLQPKAPGK